MDQVGFDTLGSIRLALYRSGGQSKMHAMVANFDSAVNSIVTQMMTRLRIDSRIGVTVGSRGIARYPDLISLVSRSLIAAGCTANLISSMGSHGGATSEGQRSLLAHLGITEESIGAPVLTDMDVVELGRTPSGLIAYCDRNAAECDGILVVNRVKPHTGFSEPFGSGLLKMLAVGLGKVPGASQIHRQGPAQMARAIEEIAQVFLDSGKVIGGLAIIEDAHGEIAKIVPVRPEEMIAKERELFREAKGLLPRLPVDDLDLLIVDEMGKNYSGSGMDVNVIGRWRLPGMPEPETPRIKRIVALRLSPESEGNAQGVGLADFVTRRLVDAIDPVATYTNAITSTFVERAFIPITLSSDREAIETALASLSIRDPAEARLARIRNTLHLDEVWLSAPLLAEVAGRPGIDVGPLEPLRFAGDGTLLNLAR